MSRTRHRSRAGQPEVRPGPPGTVEKRPAVTGPRTPDAEAALASIASERPAFGTTNRRGLLLVVAVLALTAAVYAPVRGYEFVSVDDHIYITDNPHLRAGLTWSGITGAFTSTYANFWHPVTILSLMVDVALFGMLPGPLHVTNLLLHLGSTLVLFLALLRMTGAAGRCAFVAALFALHPLHVESVAWVAERKDVLSTLFWMLSLWAWTGYAQAGRRRFYGLALGFFVLGLMAKPMLVTLPFTLLLLDVWPLGRVSLGDGRTLGARLSAWVPLLREKMPFFVLAVASGVAAFVAQQQGGAIADLESLPMWLRIANALVACVTYLVKMIWPSGLVVFYPHSASVAVWPAAFSLVALVGVSVAVTRLASRQPWLAVGWFWYLVTLAPVSGLIQVGSHAMADRYTYVPLLGVFLMVAWGAPALAGSGRARQLALGATGIVVVLACAATARAQVTIWKDSLTLWRHALSVMPDNYYAHNALGLVLSDRSPAEAADHFAAASRLAPDFPNPPNNLGLTLAQQGKTAEAIAQYEEALRRAPRFALAHINLGNALLKTGRPEPAVDHFRAAIQASPRSAVGLVGLGNGLMALGRADEALTAFDEALRIDSGLAEGHYNRANALQRLGRLQAAVDGYREAIRLGADSADLRNNLAVTLQSLGRVDEAMEQFRGALRLSPESIAAHNNLGGALMSAGRPEEAAAEYREALRLSPDYAEARMNLGNALFDMGRPDDALREHQRAALAAPHSADARFNLAATLLSLGRVAEAVTEFQATLAIEGGSPDVHVALGTAFEKLGRTGDAAAQYREANRLAPGSLPAAAGLARVSAAGARNRRQPE